MMISSKRFSGVSLLLSSVALTGCTGLFGPEGYFRDRGDDYLKAKTIPPITVPAGMTTQSVGQLFVIPTVVSADTNVSDEFEVPPPGSGAVAAGARNEVKIQKLGERRWIAVSNTPDATWPRVRSFLAERGMGAAAQVPSQGVLETPWLAMKNQESSGLDRYRIQLIEGLRSNSTEIHVLQMTASDAVAKHNPDWPTTSSNPEREEWMIRQLSAYLAQSGDSQASMLAQSIGVGEQRVRLVSGNSPFLLMQVDLPRAWASVGGALNQDGMHVESSDREQHQWQVSYQSGTTTESSGDEPGLLTRIGNVFGADDESSPEQQQVRVSLHEESSDSVRVTVSDGSGQALSAQDALQYLNRIRANLL